MEKSFNFDVYVEWNVWASMAYMPYAICLRIKQHTDNNR